VRETAPAKVNLCLLVGPLRSDGRHELASVMAPISLCDELHAADAERDEVICPGVDGPNLAADAIAAFRSLTGWDGPGQRVEIVKRIPVAAGLAGGSADAAAVLRLCARRSGLGDPDTLRAIGAGLGSDVPALVEPRTVLVRGGGESVAPIDVPPFAVLVVPSPARLSTAAVYACADQLGSPREALDGLDALAHVGVNDLQAAAIALEPSIAPTLAAVRAAGAGHALVCGSGPTVIGLFDRRADAARAREALGGDALVAMPWPAPAAATAASSPSW
jgi:4-diphosphocytidyl-2-C-methyl-D-erythritol kinase